MKKATIQITIIKNDAGKLFIDFGGFTVPIKDNGDNSALIANLEVELNFALNNEQF